MSHACNYYMFFFSGFRHRSHHVSLTTAEFASAPISWRFVGILSWRKKTPISMLFLTRVWFLDLLNRMQFIEVMIRSLREPFRGEFSLVTFVKKRFSRKRRGKSSSRSRFSFKVYLRKKELRMYMRRSDTCVVRGTHHQIQFCFSNYTSFRELKQNEFKQKCKCHKANRWTKSLFSKE